jgi:hypothetical protein
VTVNGTWLNNTVNAVVTISGNLTVNTGATFTPGTGAYTFSGTSKTIDGTLGTLSIPTLTATGTIANSVTTLTVGTLLTVTSPGTFTNNASKTVTATTALSGTGSFIQSANSVLNIGGTSGITTLDASASPNDVNYTPGATAQTIHGGTYYNLTITKNSGVAATLGAAITVNYNLTLTGGGNLTDAGYQITGNATGTFSITGTSTLTLGSAGTATNFPTGFTNANITLPSGSIVTYNAGVAQNISNVPTYSNLTLAAAAGTITKTATGAITVNSTLTISVHDIFADGGFTITAKDGIVNNGTHSGAGEIYLNGGSGVHAISGATSAFGNLELDDTYGATLTGTGTTTISGNLIVTQGTLTLNAFTTALAVTGTTTMGNTGSTAQITVNSVTGTRTFTGLVTVGANGTWNNSINATDTFRGGITLNASGTFTAGTAIQTFDTNSQALTGTFSIPSVTVTGAAVVLTNNNSLTVNTALAGTGGLTQAASATLNLGGTSGITGTLDASANPNTVNYTTTAGGQAVRGATYYNLTLSNTSNTDTANGAISVNGTLTTTSGGMLNMSTFALGGTLTVTNNGTIETFNTSSTPIPASLTWQGTFTYAAGTGAQTIITGTYNNLTLTNTSGTDTAGAAITVNSTLTTTSGGTFSDGGFTITVKGNSVMSGSHTGTGEILFTSGSAVHNVSGGGSYTNVELNDSNGVTQGGGLILNGNLTITAGTWTTSASTITVAGTTTISNTGTLTMGSAGGKTFGDITIASGGVMNFAAAAPITMNGSLTINGTGAITGTTGTWTFQKVGGGTISGTTSNTLSLASATFTTSYSLGLTSTIPTVTVTGAAVVLTNNSTLTVNTALSSTGQLTQGAGSVLNIGGTSGIATLDASICTPPTIINEVHYTSTTAAQTIHTGTYCNLFIDKSGQTGTLGGAITVNNNLTVTAGNLADGGFQITGNGTGTFIIPSSSTLTLGTTTGSGTSFPTGFIAANITLPSGSTVNYNSNFAQTISNIVPYSNLTTTATGAVVKTAAGAITVNGNFTNGANNTFADGGYTITLKGNSTMTAGGSHTGAGKIYFNGGSGTHTVTGAGHYTNVELDDSNGVTQSGATNIDGTLTITSGTWTSNAALNVTGLTSVFSTLAAGSAGTKTLGNLTINNGGMMFFNAGARPVIMNGNLTINGTGAITGTTGTWTFQKIGGGSIGGTMSGTLTLGSATFGTQYSISFPLTVNTFTVNTGITETNTLTITATTIAGPGNLTQGTGAILYFNNSTMSGTLNASATGNEVHYTGGGNPHVLPITYYNLIDDKPTGNANCNLGGTTTVLGNLTVNSGTGSFTTQATALTVYGTTDIYGSLNDANTAGTQNFEGLVTIHPGGNWGNSLISSSGPEVSSFNLQNGIANNGTFLSGSGTYTFGTNNQSITGSSAVSIDNLVVTGIQLTNSNSSSVSAAVSLSGTGELIQDTNSVLNIGGTSAVGTLTATASGNTVNYNGAGAQTVQVTPYNNLTLSTSGDKTMTGVTTINGNFSMSGSATATTASAIAVGGNVDLSGTSALTGGAVLTVTGNITIGATATFVGGAFTHNVAGNWTNNGGTFTNTGTTINFNGSGAQTIGGSASTTFNNLTINNTSGIAASVDTGVDGILNLAVANPSSTVGLLDMSTYTLTMGGSATTVGPADVTGIVKRTTLVAGTSYTFGNQYTTINFQNIGTLPTDMSIRIAIGSVPTWKLDAIKRTYEGVRTGGSGSYATVNLHYLDSELNSNTENTLVKWASVSPFTTATEDGRSNYDTTNNWVGTSSFDISLLPTSFGSREATLADTAISGVTWNGSISTDWMVACNWTSTPGSLCGVPSDLADVTIPDASTTPNDPILDPILAIGRLTLDSGAILNTAAGYASTVTISGNGGAWSNNGGTFNAGTGATGSTIIFTNAAATISGVTDFYNVTINPGAGVTMGSGGTMRIGGTMTNNGTWRAAQLSGTTVEYNGGSQTVLNPNGLTPGYDSLILSGSGTKTMPGTALSVLGNFSTAGTVTVAPASALTIGGTVTLGSGTTFTGGAYTHDVGGDWDNNGATIDLTGTTINLDGSSAQATNGSAGTTFDNLTLNNSSGLTLGNNETISGTLALTSGNITTNANNIYINSTGSVSGGSTGSHIIGNLRKYIATGATSETFEIGDTPNYTPVSIAFGNVTVAGDLTLSTVSGNDPDIASSDISSTRNVNRYWIATNSGITFDNYSAVFNFVAGDIIGGANTANFIVGKYSSGWTYPAVGTKTSTSTQATGITGFGDFQIGEPAGPTFVSATTNTAGTVVTVTFSKIMADPAGDQSQFTVLLNGTADTVSAAALNGTNNKIDLTLTNPVYEGDTVTVAYTAGTVVAADTGVLATFGAQSVTNASTVPLIISVVVSDGVVSYGAMPAGGTESTIQLSNTQKATNNGNANEDFKIKGANTTGCVWQLAATQDLDQYYHKFSTDSGTSWTPLTDAGDQSLASNVAPDDYQNFDLKIGVPNSTSCIGTPATSIITVLATRH